MAKHIKQLNKSKIAIIANKKMSIQLDELKTKLNDNEISSEILIVENQLDAIISEFLNISIGKEIRRTIKFRNRRNNISP